MALKKHTASKDDGFQLESGNVIANFVDARTPGAAFRKVMKATKAPKNALGKVARFRIVHMSKGKLIFRRSPWYYQRALNLLKSA